jgi:membrane-bound lytic murein transglycosylase B
MDPVTAVGLAASVVQLIDTTLKVIQYANDVKNASKDQAKLAIEATSLLSLLMSMRYDLEQTPLDEKWFEGIRSLAVKDGPLDQFKVALEDLAQKIETRSGVAKLGAKLLWPMEKKEVGSILQKIERMKALITLAYSKDTL